MNGLGVHAVNGEDFHVVNGLGVISEWSRCSSVNGLGVISEWSRCSSVNGLGVHR